MTQPSAYNTHLFEELIQAEAEHKLEACLVPPDFSWEWPAENLLGTIGNYVEACGRLLQAFKGIIVDNLDSFNPQIHL